MDNRGIDSNRVWWVFVTIAALAAIAMWIAVIKATAAAAHDWYPVECCHSLDCAPVTSTAYVAGAAYDSTGKAIASPMPELVVTTKIGTAVVPPDMPRRISPDNQMHACINNTGMGSYVMCIFIPPGM